PALPRRRRRRRARECGVHGDLDRALSRPQRRPRSARRACARVHRLALTPPRARGSLDAMEDVKVTPVAGRARPQASPSPYRDLLGATPRMQRLFRLVQRIAPSESTVLLTGESGTGKELFA